ncbi:MAG TPA: dihydrofolate reductase family protein [Acidimicrobiales bacterium]|nr:dihydrofolate reductase family protein [Acidimicrobiales bacterium]
MADLVYTANISVDGYTEDRDGRLDWSEPDEEVFSFVTELEKPARTYLYGRRMYEAMLVWGGDTPVVDEVGDGYVRQFAEMWRAADKVVFSRRLQSVSGARTRLERHFDPDAVRRMKAAAGPHITIGGADLAGQAMAAGLVDELRLLTVPVVLGGGKRWLPDSVSLSLRLLETRRFSNGVVYLRYRVGPLRPTR